MGKHVRILGWLHITLGVIDLLIGMAAFGFLSGIGVLSGDLTLVGRTWSAGLACCATGAAG